MGQMASEQVLKIQVDFYKQSHGNNVLAKRNRKLANTCLGSKETDGYNFVIEVKPSL